MVRKKNDFVRWAKVLGVTSAGIGLVVVLFNLLVDYNGVFGIPLISGFNSNKAYSSSDRITKFYFAKATLFL